VYFEDKYLPVQYKMVNSQQSAGDQFSKIYPVDIYLDKCHHT